MTSTTIVAENTILAFFPGRKIVRSGPSGLCVCLRKGTHRQCWKSSTSWFQTLNLQVVSHIDCGMLMYVQGVDGWNENFQQDKIVGRERLPYLSVLRAELKVEGSEVSSLTEIRRPTSRGLRRLTRRTAELPASSLMRE
jgi:hypothetical protein